MRYDCVTIGDSFEDVFVVPEEAKVRHDGAFTSGMSLSFELGDKIALDEVDYEIGGSACNVAVGLSRFSLKSSVVSIIGEDTPAEKIRERLGKEDVDRSNLIVNKKNKIIMLAKTSIAIIQISMNLLKVVENIILLQFSFVFSFR